MVRIIFSWIMFVILVACFYLDLNGVSLYFNLYIIGWLCCHDYDLYKKENE